MIQEILHLRGPYRQLRRVPEVVGGTAIVFDVDRFDDRRNRSADLREFAHQPVRV